jgi:isocitrate dehydrogenase kinase/phosphatase
MWERLKAAKTRRAARRSLFTPGEPLPLRKLPPDAQAGARRAAGLILSAHRAWLAAFDDLTAKARQAFEDRAWTQGALDAEQRVRLYRSAVNEVWRKLRRLFPERLHDRPFWLGARQVLLESVFDDYDADLALTFFYSTMRIAFDEMDAPVEYADDGLGHAHAHSQVSRTYPAAPGRLAASIERLLRDCQFHARFENLRRDAALVSARLGEDWRLHAGSVPPREIQMLTPIFFRDREAYLAGKLRSRREDLPVVLALRHTGTGIAVDAVLSGKEDMRNILFVSTRSTFHVRTGQYREVLAFLDSMAPERGHPAMCAVLGFTHPARVALNQALRRHLPETGERFAPAPGRAGTAMVVFAPPSFPYVFKVVRDFSAKEGWAGRNRIMDLYRWVHEMNRGRLMLDAWLYRNLHFPREAFAPGVLAELLAASASSVRLESDTVILKHVYAQRRVRPLNTFFDETSDPALRESAADALGAFIKDLAGMGFFVGDHYGLTFNTGLTHGMNVALFDFDDLAPLLRYRFRETPPMADERDELLWNSEVDGAWFSVAEDDVLVDEWERFLGVPPDLRAFFRARHGEIFTLPYWQDVQRRVLAGESHHVLPYPPERRLDSA